MRLTNLFLCFLFSTPSLAQQTADALVDQADTSQSLKASTQPEMGDLLTKSETLFYDWENGRLGIGLEPDTKLMVADTIRLWTNRNLTENIAQGGLQMCNINYTRGWSANPIGFQSYGGPLEFNPFGLNDLRLADSVIVKADGRVGLGMEPVHQFDMQGVFRTNDTIVSDKAAGAPFLIASTDVSANLNADLLDGHHGDEFVLHSELANMDLGSGGGGGGFDADGTLVDDLNADMLDGKHASDFLLRGEALGGGSSADADRLDGFHAQEIVDAARDGVLAPGSDIPLMPLTLGSTDMGEGYVLDGRTFSIDTEVVEYQDGSDIILSNRPGRTRFGSLTLRRVVPSGGTPMSLWYTEIMQGQVNRRDGTLWIAVDSDGDGLADGGAAGIEITNAWPRALRRVVVQVASGHGEVAAIEETVELVMEGISLTGDFPQYPGPYVIDSDGENFSSGALHFAGLESEVIEYQDGDDQELRLRSGRNMVGEISIQNVGFGVYMQFVWPAYDGVMRGQIERSELTAAYPQNNGDSMHLWTAQDAWPSSIRGLRIAAVSSGHGSGGIPTQLYVCEAIYTCKTLSYAD